MENAIVRVPSLEEMEVVRLINGPEAFTPDGEFILGPTDVRGFWVAAGFCAHGLAGAGGMGKLVAEWIVEGTPSARHLADGLAPLRRRIPQPRVHAGPHDRGLLDLLRRQVPGPRARRPGGRCALSPAYARLQELGAVVRREVRLGARELVRAERRGAATSRCARAAGRAGSGRPRSAPSTAPAARRAALFDETSFAKIEVSGDGAAELPRAAVRQPRRPRRRCASRTRRC